MLESFWTSGFRLLSTLCLFVWAALLLAACGKDRDERHYISVHELRINHEEYIGAQVVMRGYLSGWSSKTHGPPYLYATSDDARMRNGPASVFIDLHRNSWVKDISQCMEKFVQVSGVFRETDNPNNPGLAITDVNVLWNVGDDATVWMVPSEDILEDDYCVKEP